MLAFMEFGFSTREFEVTPERLGVYRPEIHIDNPKVGVLGCAEDRAGRKKGALADRSPFQGYPSDAGKVDRDLRGPVSQDGQFCWFQNSSLQASSPADCRIQS